MPEPHILIIIACLIVLAIPCGMILFFMWQDDRAQTKRINAINKQNFSNSPTKRIDK